MDETLDELVNVNVSTSMNMNNASRANNELHCSGR